MTQKTPVKETVKENVNKIVNDSVNNKNNLNDVVKIEEQEEDFFDSKKSILTESVNDNGTNFEDLNSEYSRKGKNVTEKFKGSLPSIRRREYTTEQKKSLVIENEIETKENDGKKKPIKY